MKFYIVEDDPNISHILKKIITDCGLGTVLGTSTDGLDALSKIESYSPDIALIDLFVPGLDGISLVKRMTVPTSAIMISQVSSKDMIGKAYEAGVKFFVQKPINAIEVRSVIERVIEGIESQQKLNQIRSMFMAAPEQNDARNENADKTSKERDAAQRLSVVLRNSGIVGQSGTDAITTSVLWLNMHPNALNEMSLKQFFEQFSSQPKSFEQKIRRTAATALNNLAYMGIDDYSNPVFQDYAHVLFSFREVRAEMNGIKSNTDEHGTVNIRKFLEGLSYLCMIDSNNI